MKRESAGEDTAKPPPHSPASFWVQNELKALVYSFLPAETLCACLLAHHDVSFWKRYGEDLWRARFMYTFGWLYPFKLSQQTWLEGYRSSFGDFKIVACGGNGPVSMSMDMGDQGGVVEYMEQEPQDSVEYLVVGRTREAKAAAAVANLPPGMRHRPSPGRTAPPYTPWRRIIPPMRRMRDAGAVIMSARRDQDGKLDRSRIIVMGGVGLDAEGQQDGQQDDEDEVLIVHQKLCLFVNL